MSQKKKNLDAYLNKNQIRTMPSREKRTAVCTITTVGVLGCRIDRVLPWDVRNTVDTAELVVT